ncbi:MAG TPA: pseudouridine synthase [Rectinema sp.]|nr:pseudouridine synthase [Rectinema sp.]
MSEPKEKSIRLHAYLASLGIASRRSCEEMIREGRVTVDGVKASIGQKIVCNERIEIDGEPIIVTQRKRLRYILLNKPKGYLSSLSDPYGRPCAIDLISGNVNERIYNIGRLDQWSSGLLLFTNDGDLASKLMHPSGQIEKEYRILTDVPIPENFASSFMRGIIIDGIRYRARSVQVTGLNSAVIVLIEGKNREIRRVLEHFDLHAKLLERVRFGPICDTNLAPGQWRELTENEVQALKAFSDLNQKSKGKG